MVTETAATRPTVSRTVSGGIDIDAVPLPDGGVRLSGPARDALAVHVGEERVAVSDAAERFRIDLPPPKTGLIRVLQGDSVRCLVYVTPESTVLTAPEGGLSDRSRAVFKLAEKWELPGLVYHDHPDDGAAECVHAGCVDPASRFRIGSLSKLVTAILVHRLVDLGKIDPTAPVDRYLPTTLRGVRVEDVLSNRSGLDLEIDGPWPFIDPDTLEESLAPAAPVPEETIRDLLRAATVRVKPGSGFEYRTANYWILGRIAEAVTGEAYVALARRQVFEPAGIENARLGASFPDRRAPGEVSYFALGDALARPAAALGLRDPVPAAYASCVSQRDAMGGWVLSASDLASLCAMTETVLETDRARAAFWGGADGGVPAGPWRWGQGCFLRPEPGAERPLWWVFGGIDGACGLVARLPDRTVAVLSNGTPPNRDLFLAALWRTIYRATQQRTKRG